MTMRRLLGLVMTVALVLAEPPRATGQDVAPLEAARERARTLAAKQEFDAALDVLRSAQRDHKDSAAVPLDMGRIFLARATYERANGLDATLVRALLADAMIQAKRSLALDAESQSATLLLAQAMDADGDGEGARAALYTFLERHPKDALVRCALADMFFAARNWSAADLHYTRSLEVEPENGLARLNQTEARQWLGISAPGLEKGYLEAARLLPESDRPLRLLVGLYPKEREKKLEALGKVVAANPKAAWARVWTAYILRTEEPVDPKRAFETLEEAARVAPANPAVHVNLAEMAEAAGDIGQAVREYTLAVENGADGEMRGASNALDRILNGTNLGDELPLAARERAYDACCGKNSTEGSFGNNAGFWFRDKGKDYEKSLKYYLLSVKARPDDQDFLNDTALIYLFHLTDRKSLSLPLFEKVVRLVEVERQEPIRGYWDALENLCKYWFEEGEYARTIAFATKRIEAKATLNGRPYPSMAAMQWKRRAEAEMAKRK